jgi:hypothetical protein
MLDRKCTNGFSKYCLLCAFNTVRKKCVWLVIVAHACNPALRRLRGEDIAFEASLSCIAILYLKNKTKHYMIATIFLLISSI